MSTVLQAEGIEDKPLIALAHEVMRLCSIKENDIVEVTSRTDALRMLETITYAARNNPLIAIAQEFGELPPDISIVLPAEYRAREMAAEQNNGKDSIGG